MSLPERLRTFRANIEGDFVAAVEAQRFVETMRRDHPAEFDEWMATHAVQFVTHELTAIDRRARSSLVQSARDHAFQDRDPDALRVFATPWVIDNANTRRPLGDMTAVDLQVVANKYAQDAKHKQAMSVFMNVLARKVREGGLGTRVRDVISEKRCAELMLEFVGPEALAA